MAAAAAAAAPGKSPPFEEMDIWVVGDSLSVPPATAMAAAAAEGSNWEVSGLMKPSGGNMPDSRAGGSRETGMLPLALVVTRPGGGRRKKSAWEGGAIKRGMGDFASAGNGEKVGRAG